MKTLCRLSAFAISISLAMTTFGQQQHTLIKEYEEAERVAILKGDTMQLSMLLSKQVLVQNPENKISGYGQIMERIRAGKINYASFERIIDSISLINGIAIVMGLETIVPGALPCMQARRLSDGLQTSGQRKTKPGS